MARSRFAHWARPVAALIVAASLGVEGYWIWWAVVKGVTFPVVFNAITWLLIAVVWIVILVRGSLAGKRWPENPYAEGSEDSDNVDHP